MLERYKQEFEDFVRAHISRRASELPEGARRLAEAMEYSLHSGGKRFRPGICYLAAEALGFDSERVTPFAAAVEFVHTYSLIHDDLPAMDNDDLRRGQPTNHRVFGEAQAILAGDALLTEAFFLLSDHYSTTPEIGLELTRVLSRASGTTGMIAGQVLDISLLKNEKLEAKDVTLDLLLELHALKTGALIQCAAEGVAVIAKTSRKEREALREYGRLLGLAFQLADDILDFNPEKPESSGLPRWVGVEKTRALLKETTQNAIERVSVFGEKAQGLRDLLHFNFARPS